MYFESAVFDAGAGAAEQVRADLPVWPSSIELHKLSRTLELVWGDTTVALPHRVLRASCRCGHCQNAIRKGGQLAPIAADVEVLRIEFIGESGLRFFFSDGHDRGIFPWSYLLRLAFGGE